MTPLDKASLKRLIAKGKTKQVINALLAIIHSLQDQDLHHEIIMQSSHLETFNKSTRQGLLSIEEQKKSIAAINTALLQLIDKLPNNIIDIPELNKKKKKSQQLKIGIFIIVTLLIAFILNTNNYFFSENAPSVKTEQSNIGILTSQLDIVPDSAQSSTTIIEKEKPEEFQENYKSYVYPSQSKYARLIFFDTIFNFGSINQNQVLTHIFYFKNDGDVPIKIRNVYSNCECIKIKDYPATIPVDTIGEIKIELNSLSKLGEISEEILIITNTEKNKIILEVKGEITTETIDILVNLHLDSLTVWFIDKNKNEYRFHSDKNGNVIFKNIPQSLLGTGITVNFEKGENKDFEKILFFKENITLPSSFQNLD